MGGGLYTGSLNLLILLAVADGPLHGYGIGRWIRRTSAGALGVGEGQLYPTLHRMARTGWLKETRGETETGREAKFYELTAAGRRRLEREREGWQEYSAAMQQIIASRN